MRAAISVLFGRTNEISRGVPQIYTRALGQISLAGLFRLHNGCLYKGDENHNLINERLLEP